MDTEKREIHTRLRVVARGTVGAVGAGVGRVVRHVLLRRTRRALDLLDVGRLMGRRHLLLLGVRRGIVGGGGRLGGLLRLVRRVGVLLMVELVLRPRVVRVRGVRRVRVVRVVGWRWQALLLRVGVMLEVGRVSRAAAKV